ncbi:MAG: hypothetical protein P8P29_07585 [Flavobacteriaceae bacterium]|nr:hypothetical protein [Flavobacteriaceae bacterium]
MTNKSTTVKAKSNPKTARVKITNESKLVLPQDIGGFTANFRREAARSVGRIMADPEKLTCFLELLDKFKEYAIDRHENSEKELQTAIKAKAAKLRAAQDRAVHDAKGVINGKRAVVEQYTAEIEAHEKRLEEIQ